jgi:hypothetical protein
MDSPERLALLLTHMRRLEQVMELENSLVQGMRLDRLSDLHAEKAALADALEAQLRVVRRDAGILGALPIGARRELEARLRAFRQAARQNARILEAAQGIIERLMRRLAESLARTATRSGRLGPADPPGRVLPIALDRRI